MSGGAITAEIAIHVLSKLTSQELQAFLIKKLMGLKYM